MLNNKIYAIMKKEIKNYIANDAICIISVNVNDWEINLYRHNSENPTIYVVARLRQNMEIPIFNFFNNHNDALNFFNTIYNIVR